MKNKLYDMRYKLISALMAFFSIFPFILNMKLISESELQHYVGRLNRIFNELRLSLDGNNTFIFILFILLIVFYHDSYIKNVICFKWKILLLTLFFSSILIFAESYQRYASWDGVYGCSAAQTIKVLLFGLGIGCLLYVAFCYLEKMVFNKKEQVYKECFICSFSIKSIIISFAFILLCWTPYLLIKYPGVLAWDTSTALKLYFDKNQINNAVPALQVLIFSFFIEVGSLIGSENSGLFLYVVVQTLLFAFTLAYFVCYLEKINIRLIYRFLVLGLVSFLPIYPYTAMQMGSDVTYTITILLYIMFLLEINKTKEKISIWKCVFEVVVLVCMTLFRHTGIYIVLISMLVGVWGVEKEKKKSFLLIHIIAIAVYILWTSVCLPNIVTTNNMAGNSSLLTITKQQMANYIVLYGNEITGEDRELLAKIIDLEKVKEAYNPELADGITMITDNTALNSNKLEYLMLWFKCFFRHPDAYIQATINMWYGYFYPDYLTKTKYYMFYELHNIGDSQTLNIQYSHLYDYERQVVDSWWNFLYKMPIIGTLFGIGIYVWMLIYSIINMIISRNREILAFIPVILTLMVCMLSPVCGYTRYAFPIMFAMPFLFGLNITYRI